MMKLIDIADTVVSWAILGALGYVCYELGKTHGELIGRNAELQDHLVEVTGGTVMF